MLFYSLHLPHHLSFTHFQMYFNIYFTSWHYFFSEFRLSLIPYMQKTAVPVIYDTGTAVSLFFIQ